MSNKNGVILQIKDIHTYYGDSYVLQGVSLEVPQGSVVALLGRNGVGKTTLLRSVIGFTPPRRGKVIFKRTDITYLAPEARANLGVSLVPQGRRIFPSLSVRENLLVAERKGQQNDWTMEKVFELFPRLKERALNPGGKLSGGEQQMLSIARALIRNPDLLLMDEPTEGLAPLLVNQVKDVIKACKAKSLAVLLVEQNVNFALDVADYIYVMSTGKIVYESSPEEFRANKDAWSIFLGI